MLFPLMFYITDEEADIQGFQLISQCLSVADPGFEA